MRDFFFEKPKKEMFRNFKAKESKRKRPYRANSKRIVQLDAKHKVINEFDNALIAAEILGISPRKVGTRCIAGRTIKNPIRIGYILRYYDEWLEEQKQGPKVKVKKKKVKREKSIELMEHYKEGYYQYNKY